MMKPKRKQVSCKWCGHSISITKDIQKAYLQGREDRDKELIDVIRQVAWERDVAIHQLEQLGYGFGEKIEKSSSEVEKDLTE